MLYGFLVLAVFPAQGETTRITQGDSATHGVQADAYSNLTFLDRAVSADGRYVVFRSDAGNLVGGDTNGVADIFFHDVTLGATIRVSVDSSGAQANGGSYNPSISADGRYVAFRSDASNLVAGDTNGVADVFVRDNDTGIVTRVSVDGGGIQGNGDSTRPSISPDGRIIAFSSVATNLVAGDTNSASDIFIRDTGTDTTTRVSVDDSGNQGDGPSYNPAISAFGSYVAFYSAAGNLVADDTNGVDDVFVHDTDKGVTTRVSVDNGGAQGINGSYNPSISADGRYVAFRSDAGNLVADDTNGVADIFIRDTDLDTTTRVSVDGSGVQANDGSRYPSISLDGQYVAFRSDASNLVANDTNGNSDIFLHDTGTGATTRVSVDDSGNQGTGNSDNPSLSGDGHYVFFQSDAGNLVADDTNGFSDIFVRDTDQDTTTRVNLSSALDPDEGSNLPFSAKAISADGHRVAFHSYAENLVEGDVNGEPDVFLYDIDTGVITLVSVDSSGNQGNDGSLYPSISADGRYVAFESDASNLVEGDTNTAYDVFVHDTATGTTTRVSVDSGGGQGDMGSHNPSISEDGRYVAFSSSSTNLVAGDTNGVTDIFVRDTDLDTTTRVSVDSSGNQGNGDSNTTEISADGSHVTFYSLASNLVAGDANDDYDVFLHDRGSGSTILVSVDGSGNQGNDGSYNPSISADGRYVAFYSSATNLVPGDSNGKLDVFVRDTVGNTTTRVSVDGSGNQSNDNSYNLSISNDGLYVAFESPASNLVADDTNGVWDVFVHDTVTGNTVRVSVDDGGTQGNDHSYQPSISADGSAVTFVSRATNLDGGSGLSEIFLFRGAAELAVTSTLIDSDTPDPSVVGDPVTITFSVTGGTPTGDVTVTASTGESCSDTLSGGSGSCDIVFDTTGSRDLTAVYAGDGSHAGSTSPTEFHQVDPVPGPSASFTADPNPAACGDTITFDASASSAGHSSRTLVSWEWDLDNDGQFDDAGGVTTSHAFDALGSHLVGLQVTDDADATDTDTQTVNVGNSPPVADAGGPYTIDYGSSVTLDGNASSDPDTDCGDAVSGYAWDIDNDGYYDNAGGVSPTIPWSPQLAALGPGTHTIGLQVTDSLDATGTATTTLTIKPGADLAVTNSDGVTSAVPGQGLTYTIVAGNDGPSDVTGASLTDTFPAVLDCSWTSTATGGATGNTAAGGNLDETLDLPSGSSVSYTVNCTIAAGATGTLSNTATLSSTVDDPVPANNSATDDDTVLVGFTVTESDGTTQVEEGGATDGFTVVLIAQPQNPVVITVTSADTGEATLDKASLTFTDANWNQPQTVTVTGQDDSAFDGDQTTTVTLHVDDDHSDDAFDPVDDRTVTVTVTDTDVQTYTGPTATGSGDATLTISGGTCTLDLDNTAFIVTDGLNLPRLVEFPHGAVTFRVTGCALGASIDVTLTLPTPLEDGSAWKLDEVDDPIAIPGAVIDGNTLSYQVTDGGPLDGDGVVDGNFSDPAAPGMARAAITGVPTLSPWGLWVLAVSMLLFGWRALGGRRLS